MSAEVAEKHGVYRAVCIDEVESNCVKSIPFTPLFFNYIKIYKSLVDSSCNCVLFFLIVICVSFTGYDAALATQVAVGIIAIG